MVTKVTITIPDDLAKRLEPWRERMNISRVCSEAIAKEVAILADLPQQAQELTDLIHKLRTQKMESDRLDYEVGFKDGTEYASDADYDEFVTWCESPMDEAYKIPEFAEEGLNERLQEGDVLNANQYRQGFQAGMIAVWERIKDKI